MTAPSIIKIGLLVDDDSIPFWIAHSIEQLLESGCASISLIPHPVSAADTNNPHPSASLRNKVYRWYEKFDSRLKRRDPAFDSRVALSELLPDTDTLDIGKARADGIDILFNACTAMPYLESGLQPTYGFWTFCDGDGDDVSDKAGDNKMVCCVPDGFRELTSGAATTAVSLRMISQLPDQLGHYKSQIISSSNHLPDILLLGRQRHNALMQAASQFPAAVERLFRVGGKQFMAELAQRCELQNDKATQSGFTPNDYQNNCYPNNWQTCLYLLQHAWRYAGRKLRKLIFFEQWCLLVHYDADNTHCMELEKFTEIIPPDDRIWADPFVVADKSDKTLFHIFIEEMKRGKSHGHISVVTMDAQGNYKDAVPIIERPYHMSYPYIFEFQNERYMIPETGDNHTIELYRCVEFPYQWEFVHNLMEGSFAVDTTLHEDKANARWWMFTTIRQNDHTDCLDELHLFHADSPLSSDWQPHQLNPVSRDVTIARPAGSLFAASDDSGERLYRPSQYGGYHYGWGININEVTRLDTERYEETRQRLLAPTWRRSVVATHTLNHASGMTVSDVRKLRFRWLA